MVGKDDVHSLADLKNAADPIVEIQALRSERKKLRAEMRRMQKEYGNLQTYFTDLKEAVEGLVIPPQIPQFKPGKSKKVTHPCTAVLHLTDWHYGAVQEAEEVEFANAFSPEILEARITNLVFDFLKWVEVQRNGYHIPNLTVIVTGDLISGDIHRELQVTNAFPTPVQATKVGFFLGQVLCMLSPHFEAVQVEFAVPDNHARLTKKPQAKQQGLNTHNYVTGFVTDLVVKEQENITFSMHIAHTKAVTVCNRQYLITHGHGVMGWAGFPYYGIERKVAKEALARLHEPEYNRFHKVIMGHWHAPLWHPWYWIGGSASGTDAYDHKQGRRSPPIQTAWLIHPEKNEFNRMEFDLHEEEE